MPGRVHLGARGFADPQPLLTEGQLRRDQAYLYAPHAPKDNAVKYGDEKRGWFDIRPSSHLKRRIPATSVVNLVCTMQGPLYGVTAAQTIWFLNLIAFGVHFFFFWWTIILICGWDGKTRDLHAPVFRVRANWTSPDVSGYNFDLKDNDQGFDIGVSTAVWFGITAGFHFLALIAGLWERFWHVYWRQLDDAFVWWRWLEYSLSASFMVLGIAFSLGMREENIMTCFFILTWTTMMLGFTNELYSRPRTFVDKTVYDTPIREKNTRVEDINVDDMALKLIAGEAWEGDRPQMAYDTVPTEDLPSEVSNVKPLPYRSELIVAQRQSNYLRRMWPFFLGWVPFLTVWVLMIKFLVTSVDDVKDLSSNPDRDMPEWVKVALWGTFILYTSFAPVMAIYQFLPPAHYWGSEVVYIVLSLFSKVYLGIFLLMNVILSDEVEAAAKLTTT